MPEQAAHGEAADGRGGRRRRCRTADVKAHEVLTVDPVNEAPEQVIFGLRPCDARGFVQMDNVFGGYGGFYFDPYYNAKREATTLLAVTCATPRSTCFCTAVGGEPGRHRGRRCALHPGGGRLHGRGADPQGRGGCWTSPASTEASAGQSDAAAAVKDSARPARVDAPFDLDGVAANLRANLEDPAWHDLAMRCISCGTCTYVCPNCYCFTINDEMVESKGERFRTWDNCFNPSYTLETSGHNPRDAQGQPVPQPLQPQVLVLPREVRQPAVLGLRALRHALPHPHRHPRGGAAPWACRGPQAAAATAGEEA